MNESLQAAITALQHHKHAMPQIAIVLGSGLGTFADNIDARTEIPYQQIPGMPQSHVSGHAGKLMFGSVQGVPVVLMAGRVHMYEGYSASEVVLGTRLMLRLGAKVLIVTNAAGGINTQFNAGDLMLIRDHINLTAQNCLCGPNDETLGTRFPDMSHAYDPALCDLADSIAQQHGFVLRRGVYAGVLGPNYETPAEIRMLAAMGADAVGMSTVQEVIAAKHMDARVLGLSCITNMAAGISPTPLSHHEVKVAADRAAERFSTLLNGIIAGIGTT